MNYHRFESFYRSQWKQLAFVSERMLCIHVCQILFSVVPIHRTVRYKNESRSDDNSLSRKNQKCALVTQVSSNFSVMLCIVFQDISIMKK